MATSTSVTRDATTMANVPRARRTRRESSGRELLRILRRPAARCPREPEDHAARDQEQPPRVAVGPQRRPRQQDGDRDGEEAEPDQRPRAVAPVAERRRGDRVLLALVGDDERRGGVDQDAGPAQEGEDDEADAEDCGVDLEVASQAPADAGKHAIRPAALQPADLGDMCRVFAHESRMAPVARGDHPE